MKKQFKVIERDFDWQERIPFEISIVFETQYYYNPENEHEEIQRFTLCNFGDFETIIDRSYHIFIDNVKLKKFHDENGTILNTDCLYDLFREYHRGFIDGYTELNQTIKDTTSIFNDTKTIATRVFKVVELDINRFRSIPTTVLENDHSKKVVKKSLLYQAGKNIGLQYKAWHYILDHPNNFLELFRNSSQVIDYYKRALQYWIPVKYSGMADEISELLAKFDKSKQAKSIEEVFKTLADAVVRKDAETAIYKVLIDAELIDGESKIFKDKANGNVGHFYSTIITFFEKGYLKRKPTTKEYLNICRNTFKLDVSESTAKNHKTRALGLSNIPSFS